MSERDLKVITILYVMEKNGWNLRDINPIPFDWIEKMLTQETI